MGLFSYFRNRRDRESAVSRAEIEGFASGFEAEPEPEESIGTPVPGVGAPPINVSVNGGQPDVAQIVGMVGDALRTGQFQVHQSESQVLDLRGSGLREDILDALRQAGVDPETGGSSIDASDHGDLQQQILSSLERHGIDLGEHAGGVQIPPDQDGDSRPG